VIPGLTQAACQPIAKKHTREDANPTRTAEWMRAPVADVPNNWIQVRREGAKYIASVGKETFDVELMISLSGGEILSATLDNVVEATARECANVELTDCGDPRPERTVRRIEMTLTGRLRRARLRRS
jgi:hypothetical protein